MARKQTKMPYVERHDNGVFYVFFYNRAKKRGDKSSLDTRDEREAMQRFKVWITEEYDLAAGTLREAPTQETVTCGQVLDYYRQNHIDAGGCKDPDTRRHNQKWLERYFSDIPVARLEQRHINEYVAKRAPKNPDAKGKARGAEIGRGAGSGTVRGELEQLITAIKYVQDTHGMDKALVGLSTPKFTLPDHAQRRERWLTREELDRLLAEMRYEYDMGGRRRWVPDRMSRLYRWGVLAYFTASRRSAIEKLTIPQIKRDQGMIELLPAGQTQTSKRRPPVPITNEYSAFIDRLLAERQSDLGYALDKGTAIYTAFQRAVKSAGLGGTGVVPHTLRHTRAVHLAQDGVDLFVIAGLLGDTFKTVQDTYLHHCPSHIRTAIERGARPSDVGKTLDQATAPDGSSEPSPIRVVARNDSL